MKKNCSYCAWAAFRGNKTNDEMIDDTGIGQVFLCRKFNLEIYGNDRACPSFSLADEFYN
ncbi:MAG: hypothetical protein ACTSVU_00650 [Promethearchaeota archaeon]